MIRHTTVLFILLAGALSLILFTVKYQVQDLEHELKTLVRNIDTNQRAIHVLNAEWSHLNNPARLRRLAERHLNMQPIGTDQLTGWPAFAARVPEAQTETPVSMAAKRNPSPLFPSLADRKADR